MFEFDLFLFYTHFMIVYNYLHRFVRSYVYFTIVYNLFQTIMCMSCSKHAITRLLSTLSDVGRIV